MDINRSIEKLAIDYARKHGITPTPSGSCAYHPKPPQLQCPDCIFFSYCRGVIAVKLDVLNTIEQKGDIDPCQELDKQFMLISVGIAPFIKEDV